VVESLYPALLDELGLAAALTHFARVVGERTGSRLDLHVSTGLGRLEKDAEIGIFRIVEEHVASLGLAAGSAGTLITLERTSEEVVLEVISGTCPVPGDGTPEAPGESILPIRAALLGGILNSQTRPEGRQFRVRFPLEGLIRKPVTAWPGSD
jgi:two-component system NarL family sensor kinase